MHSAFFSAANFSFWQRKIYSYLPSVERERLIHSYKNACDIENPIEEAEKSVDSSYSFEENPYFVLVPVVSRSGNHFLASGSISFEGALIFGFFEEEKDGALVAVNLVYLGFLISKNNHFLLPFLCFN
ncbi:hypothetical protein R6Q59_014573 [Mikania micrantha]